jgi:hypothetical protein
MLRELKCFNDDAYIQGFTPLHLAAYQGSIDMIHVLLTIGSNIYAKDKQGRSAELIARDAHKIDINKLLEEERLTACAQLIYSRPEVEINIWIGDEVRNELDVVIWCTSVISFCCVQTSMNAAFCTLIPITHVIYLSPEEGYRPPSMQWMATDDRIQLFSVEIDAEDGDMTEDSWKTVEKKIPALIQYVTPVLKVPVYEITYCVGLMTSFICSWVPVRF